MPTPRQAIKAICSTSLFIVAGLIALPKSLALSLQPKINKIVAQQDDRAT